MNAMGHGQSQRWVAMDVILAHYVGTSKTVKNEIYFFMVLSCFISIPLPFEVLGRVWNLPVMIFPDIFISNLCSNQSYYLSKAQIKENKIQVFDCDFVRVFKVKR